MATQHVFSLPQFNAHFKRETFDWLKAHDQNMAMIEKKRLDKIEEDRKQEDMIAARTTCDDVWPVAQEHLENAIDELYRWVSTGYDTRVVTVYIYDKKDPIYIVSQADMKRIEEFVGKHNLQARFVADKGLVGVVEVFF